MPDVLDELGWTGGEAIVDSRTLVHYMRTTRDGRIVFGWGGGTMGIRRALVATDSSSTAPSSARHARGARPLLPAVARPRGDARLGRPDRRLAHAPADLRKPRPRPPRVRLHRERRRPLVPRRRDPRAPRARPARRADARSRSSSRRASSSRRSRSATPAGRSSAARSWRRTQRRTPVADPAG